MTAQIEQLPPSLMQRGGSPGLLADEYLHVIKTAIDNHPRSLQRRIGPSEIGHPCARRIGYKLSDHDEINHQIDPPWLPTIGTAVHAWLEEVFTLANSKNDHARWLVELTVTVGELGGVPITGHCDLYDRVTATVWDHKVVGPTTLKKYKASGPGDQYEKQINLYARGLIARGLPVDRVGIAFLPRNAELNQAYMWTSEYRPELAEAALARAAGIGLTVNNLGTDGLALLPTADAYCLRCPFFKAGSTDLSEGCPGDPASNTHAQTSSDAPFGSITKGNAA